MGWEWSDYNEIDMNRTGRLLTTWGVASRDLSTLEHSEIETTSVQ
jgi:hypothetical protein